MILFKHAEIAVPQFSQAQLDVISILLVISSLKLLSFDLWSWTTEPVVVRQSILVKCTAQSQTSGATISPASAHVCVYVCMCVRVFARIHAFTRLCAFVFGWSYGFEKKKWSITLLLQPNWQHKMPIHWYQGTKNLSSDPHFVLRRQTEAFTEQESCFRNSLIDRAERYGI